MGKVRLGGRGSFCGVKSFWTIPYKEFGTFTRTESKFIDKIANISPKTFCETEFLRIQADTSASAATVTGGGAILCEALEYALSFLG